MTSFGLFFYFIIKRKCKTVITKKKKKKERKRGNNIVPAKNKTQNPTPPHRYLASPISEKTIKGLREKERKREKGRWRGKVS